MSVHCCYCPKATDLRPYGPGGAPICFQCATASPEREAELKANFGLLLNANEAVSPSGATVLTADGPVPFDPADIPAGSIIRNITGEPPVPGGRDGIGLIDGAMPEPDDDDEAPR